MPAAAPPKPSPTTPEQTGHEMAEVSEPDPLATPPSPKELVRQWPELDLFDPATDRIGAARAMQSR